MSAYTPGRPTITEALVEIIKSLPEVEALKTADGKEHVWSGQAPADATGIIIVIQQVGPGLGKAAIGGPVSSAIYRFQWRVGHAKQSMVGLVPIAKAIHWRLNNARNETAPNGLHLSILEDVTDLPPIAVDDSGRPMQELGGEVRVFVDFGVL